MRAQLLSLVLVFIGFSASSEVKVAGTFVAFKCGQNELKTAGPSVTSVCQGQVTGSANGMRIAPASGYAVAINKGGVTVTYFYQNYKPQGLELECGRSGFATRCLHHARLAGVIGARSLVDFNPAVTLPKDETVVYTLDERNKSSLESEFLKLKFQADQMTHVMTTQGI